MPNCTSTFRAKPRGRPAVDEEVYRREGHTVVRGVIGAGLLAEANAFVDRMLARHPEALPEALGSQLTRGEPFLHHLLGQPALLDIAEVFLGPDLASYGANFICKPPRAGRPVAWHQDRGFWPIAPLRVAALWLALTPSTPENGCLRVIPRSHLGPEFPHEGGYGGAAQGAVFTGLDQRLVDETQAVDVVMAPGDVSIHHPNLLHGSNANRSEQWRRGVVLPYIPTSSRVLKETGTQFLLRGRAVPGVNCYRPRPVFDRAEHLPFQGMEAYLEPSA